MSGDSVELTFACCIAAQARESPLNSESELVSPRRRFAASKPGLELQLQEQPNFERLLGAKLPNLSNAGA